ncbi:MAG: hypothetical protein A2136_10515 [Chloroflexi bacterium RBG_16_54_11]|nr:MAG: hypothetical protein A2136_10515 [Chloroflexi bacterium RBG_16_54_11]
MSDFLTTPGFLGTRATLRSDLTLVLTLMTALLFTIGFILARRKQFTGHRWVQTTAVISNTLVVFVSMVPSFIIYILPGIPKKFGEGDYAVTTLHAVLGTISMLFGVFVMLRGHELVPQALKFTNYKPFMRLAYSLYMLSTLGGVIIYIIIFVFGI